MTRISRVTASIALALTGSAAFGLANAQGTRIVRIDSHVSIRSRSLTFSGRVTSPNSACASGRRVTLYRTNGNVLGSTTTSSSGRWKITAQGSAGISLGHFYARVKSRREGAAGTIYVCRGAASPTIPFHQ